MSFYAMLYALCSMQVLWKGSFVQVAAVLIPSILLDGDVIAVRF
jgi:hypothetical protein